MRICVFGNSHLGMLAAACHAAPPEGAELVFWGKRGLCSTDFSLNGSTICAETADLRSSLGKLGVPDEIDLARFDALVFVGMTASVFTVAGLVSAHHVYGWPGTDKILSGSGHGPGFLSRSALADGLVRATEDDAAFRILERLRSATDAPAVVVPQPYPSVRAVRDNSKYTSLRQVLERGIGAEAVAVLSDSYQVAFGRLADTRVLLQPPGTVVHGFLTKVKFTRGAVRINFETKQSRKDILHANAAFGRLALVRLLDHFSSKHLKD